MMFVDTIFIGIDIPGGRRPINYFAIDANRDMVGIGSGTEDDVLAFIQGQDRVWVAVNCPRRLNQGVMARDDFRASLKPRPKSGRWDRWRAAEYALRMRGIKVHRTPGRAEKAPPWMRIGFSIFNALAGTGFETFSPGNAEPGDRIMMETDPHAAYTVLLERIPLKRSGLEGRLQRQLVLYVNNVNVPNPMQVFEEITRYRILRGDLTLDDLLQPSQLDAGVAAFAAWSAMKGEVTLVGHPDEGQMALPVGEMLARYA